MSTARGLLELELTDSAGTRLPSTAFTLKKPDGSALGQSVYAAASGGVPLLTLQTDLNGRAQVFSDTPARTLLTAGSTSVITALYHDPADLVTLEDTQTITGRKTLSNAGKLTFGAGVGKLIESLDEALPASYGNETADHSGIGIVQGTTASPYTADAPQVFIARTIAPSKTNGQEVSGLNFNANIKGVTGTPDVGAANGDAYFYTHAVFSVTDTQTGNHKHQFCPLVVDARAYGTNGGGTALNVLAYAGPGSNGVQGIEVDLATDTGATLDNFDPTSYPPPLGFNTGINVLSTTTGGASVNNGMAHYIQAAAGAKVWYGILFAPGAIQTATGTAYTRPGIAIDLINVTGGAYPLRVANNVPLYAENQAGNATLPLIKMDTANRVALESATGVFIGSVGGATTYGLFNTSGLSIPTLNLTVTAGSVYVGDSSNVDVTRGVTLNQGAADDQILALKSSDVAHGMTAMAETDTYAAFLKATAATGGLQIRALEQTSSASLWLRAFAGSVDGTRTTGSAAAVLIDGSLKNATGVQSLGADKNILSVRDNGTARFFLDSDGDSHQDVGTAWSNFDYAQDIVALNTLSNELARPGNPIREEFRRFLGASRAHLEALGIVQFNPDGHHFVNMSKLQMLTVGAVRQLALQVQRLEDRLQALPAPASEPEALP